MARTQIGWITSNRTGTATEVETSADVGNGNYYDDDGVMRLMLVVRNAHATLARTLTIDTPGSVDGDLAVPNRVISVPAVTTVYLGPFPSATYSNSGQIWLDGETTDIKISVVKVADA